MNSNILIRASVAILVVGWFFAAADQASAQSRAGGGGQAGGAGGGGQAVGAGVGAEGFGSNAPSAAVTGQVGRSPDRMLQDVGGAGAGGAAGLRGMGGIGGLGGGRGMGGFGGLSPFGANPFGTNNAATAQPSIRTRLVNGVEPLASRPQGAAIAGTPRQIFSAPVSRIVNGYSIDVSDGVATLSGVAKSAKDRRMAELVLKLEPGINQIDNRIVVAP